MTENHQDMVETILQYYRDIADRKKIVAAYRASGFYGEEEMTKWERDIMGDFYYWMDKETDDLTLEEARDAVKALRRIVAERITEPVKENDEKTDEWEAAYKKPPLGCKPSWLTSADRVKALSEAITRNIESPHKDTKEIRKWAKEILYHCEIMENC